jgi:hypothetical protein
MAVWLLVASIPISACGLLPLQQNQTDELILTQAAQTIQARLTQQAFEVVVAQLTQLASNPTATGTEIQPTTTEVQPTATLPSPTDAAQTTTSIPTMQTPSTATVIPIPCDKAEFVKDVTFLDGSIIAPGATFTKVWRLKNSGSCTWSSNYALVFVSGDAMNADKVIPLYNKVFPGETVDLSVELVAPTEQGRYGSFWMISNPAGQRFGYGKKADQAFWLDINVKPINKNFAYDFAVNVCAATWRSSAGGLSCMGDVNSSNGSVVLLDTPLLENGRREDESTLWTRPQITRGGWISGTYPVYQVKEGDHFRAAIGCLHNSSGCELTFSLDYQEAGNNKVNNLGSWVERYDNAISSVDVDLTALVGKQIHFILTVTTHGKPTSANAFWLVPSIRRYSPTATPTQVPPATATLTAIPTETATPTMTTMPTDTATPTLIPTETSTSEALPTDLVRVAIVN